jgi:hypothetical protein
MTTKRAKRGKKSRKKLRVYCIVVDGMSLRFCGARNVRSARRWAEALWSGAVRSVRQASPRQLRLLGLLSMPIHEAL